MYSGDEHYGDDVTSPTYRPRRPNTTRPLSREDERPQVLTLEHVTEARRAAWAAYNDAPLDSDRNDLLDAALATQRAYDAWWREWYKENNQTDPGVQGQYRSRR